MAYKRILRHIILRLHDKNSFITALSLGNHGPILMFTDEFRLLQRPPKSLSTKTVFNLLTDFSETWPIL